MTIYLAICNTDINLFQILKFDLNTLEEYSNIVLDLDLHPSCLDKIIMIFCVSFI